MLHLKRLLDERRTHDLKDQEELTSKWMFYPLLEHGLISHQHQSML
jgi:hypothetical protein